MPRNATLRAINLSQFYTQQLLQEPGGRARQAGRAAKGGTSARASRSAVTA